MTTQHAHQHVLIRRWHSSYLLPDTHPCPTKVRDRIDGAVRDDVPGVLAAELSRVFDANDDEMIFVRRLQLDFAIDAGWESHAIASQCVHALTRNLSRELALGDSSNVIRFANPAQYLARFLADRASGDAGSRWYYERFSGLHALPCSAALRTALLTDIALGIFALRALNDHELAGVTGALGNNECIHIRDVIAASQSGGDDTQAFATVVAGARETATPGGIASAAQLALWWLARSSAKPDRAFALAARAVAMVVVAIRTGSHHAAIIWRAVIDNDAGATSEFARSDVEAFLHLRACPPALLRELIATNIAAPGVSDTELLGSTPFGGAFILLDDLFALPLERATKNWPDLDSTPAPALLRFLILCNCSGGSRAAGMFLDPLWRRLFGIAPTIDRIAVVQWLTSLGPHCRRRYARLFSWIGASAKTEWRQAHDRNGQRYRILLDGDGNWLSIGRLSVHHENNDLEPDTPLDGDVDHVVAQTDGLPPAWSLLFAMSAQRVLRRFLRRLPGFSASHLTYAQCNLLEFSASADAQAERIVVLLGRPSLGLILNLTGCDRGTRSWPALDARPFALFNN